MNNPQLSIITPVHNGEHHIASCLECVIKQSCPQVEHIIVDGASTDRTVAIVKDCAQKHPHIRWVSEKDQGQSDAMNKGVAMAKGPVVGFLNVDDFYESGILNRIVDIFKTLPEPSFVAGNCNVWNKEGLWFVNKPKKLGLIDLLLGGNINPHPINPSAYFYHKSLHQSAGFYKQEEHYALDLDFILRAVKVAYTKYFDEPWGNFRFLEGTKTYADQAGGQARERAVRIINIYRDTLPQWQKWQVIILRDAILKKRKFRSLLSGKRNRQDRG